MYSIVAIEYDMKLQFKQGQKQTDKTRTDPNPWPILHFRFFSFLINNNF